MFCQGCPWDCGYCHNPDLRVPGRGALRWEDIMQRLRSRIGLLGGFDMDFLCRSTPDEVFRRCKAMIERTQARGGYALGSGNSIPYYVPAQNYDAMRRAAEE